VARRRKDVVYIQVLNPAHHSPGGEGNTFITQSTQEARKHPDCKNEPPGELGRGGGEEVSRSFKTDLISCTSGKTAKRLVM